ncbi:hypothetical protein [Peribacillus sp. TH24]|uniref:pPIWI-associating nuclease domain-containing protein n=1 Tax=Peribacillus sp. TH24 TaxID=2798483 RepID=UPI001912EB69|nr:hypothetical protein [Peribacillus sp. TH24]MBK5446050.1 hypothetical protein [Peribacillus sp. TH24]
MYEELSRSILGHLKTDFQKDIFLSSIEIIQTEIKTKFSNFATNIRELSREVLKDLAPDDEVKNCKWYSKETPEGKADITRIQRMTYAVKGGLSNEFILEELEFDFSDVTYRLNRVIKELNKYTHINQKVYYREEKTGYEMVESTLIALNNFLLTIKGAQDLIMEQLESSLDSIINEELTSNVIQEIDILATHYRVEGVYINNIKIESINSQSIDINIEGSVDVQHQYGSDGDLRRGDGVEFENSYTFNFDLIQDIDNPFEINLSVDDIGIETDSFYE